MAVEATTTCKRVVGPVVAAALMVGAVGVTAAPAQAAQASGPADYAAQASRAADWLLAHLPAEDAGEVDTASTDRRAAA